jgi:UDP-2-acetamido-3-amino-2,3-dideoxy-glucuronate N-acetyltransferase
MIQNPRVSVVGCGYWGKNLVRNFAQIGALESVCDANPGAVAAQTRAFAGVRGISEFSAVLADDAVDGVVLATPAAVHYEQARAALLAGKHVFVEKPLALCSREGAELVELADTRGLTLMVGHILEYHPAVALLRQIVTRGDLGRLLYIYSNRLNLGKVRQVENILWSFAPHDIAVICSLVGAAPVRVTSSGGTYLQTGVEDVTVTNLEFEGGVRAHIFVSWLHPYKEQKLVVVGDKRMAVFDDTARDGKLRVYDKGIEWKAGVPVPRQTSETLLFFDETEPLRLECEEFVTSIRTGRRPLTDGPSALRVLQVLEASQTSLDRGGLPVPLEIQMAQAVAV